MRHPIGMHRQLRNQIRAVVSLAMLLCWWMTAAAQTQAPLAAVSHVDLGRYVGTWYEIARYPNRFQKDCASNTMAQYTLLAGGDIRVINSCRQADGTQKVARGKAKIADPQSRAKLKVTFFWPFYGDYWVIGLAPDYSYAIVGEPARKYLWILSRTPRMDDGAYKEAIEKIRVAGYDPSRLQETPQSPR